MLYFIFFVFLLGLCVGSFLNVVINRLETKEKLAISRSHCPKCKKTLRSFDLIPLLSFIFLKGKCRYCHKKISWQYPLVELATGLLFLIVALKIDISGMAESGGLMFTAYFYYLTIVSFLIIITVYDLKHYLIPDEIIYTAIVFAFFAQLARAVYFGNLLSSGYWLFIALLSSAGFFLLLVLISKGRWMGLGDVKLAVLMGLVLSWPNILVALFLSFFIGAVVGIALILLKKKKLKSEIPFGPFLSLATLIAVLYGRQIIDWYLKILL